jgi:hypothetical protein
MLPGTTDFRPQLQSCILCHTRRLRCARTISSKTSEKLQTSVNKYFATLKKTTNEFVIFQCNKTDKQTLCVEEKSHTKLRLKLLSHP